MMLHELSIEEVAWCQQGHPVLILQETSGPHQVAVALAIEDAQALAPHPEQYGSGRARFCDTFADTLLRAGGRLLGIQLSLGPRGILQAHLQGSGANGAFTVPAHASDGFILACRHHLPLWITAETLLRIGTIPDADTRDHHAIGHQPSALPPAQSSAPTVAPSGPDPLAPFRTALEGIYWPESDDPTPR
jgi:hypothetical protein